MGEYADMLIDSMIDGCWGQFDVLPRRRGPRKKTCIYCDTKNLRWQNVEGGKWRLFTTDGELHECDEARTPAIEYLRNKNYG